MLNYKFYSHLAPNNKYLAEQIMLKMKDKQRDYCVIP